LDSSYETDTSIGDSIYRGRGDQGYDTDFRGQYGVPYQYNPLDQQSQYPSGYYQGYSNNNRFNPSPYKNYFQKREENSEEGLTGNGARHDFNSVPSAKVSNSLSSAQQAAQTASSRSGDVSNKNGVVNSRTDDGHSKNDGVNSRSDDVNSSKNSDVRGKQGDLVQQHKDDIVASASNTNNKPKLLDRKKVKMALKKKQKTGTEGSEDKAKDQTKLHPNFMKKKRSTTRYFLL
jgi:hypothetical protein